MSEFTDYIEEKWREKRKWNSRHHFLKETGIDSQAFIAWQKGTVPNDATLNKIANKLDEDFIFLAAIAKMQDAKGNSDSKNEWRKLANNMVRKNQGIV